MANAIEKKLHEIVLPELVAEARADGVGWAAIGKTLGISPQGAQNRFGREPASDRGDLQQMEDKAVFLSNQILDNFPADSPAVTEIMDELGETTPEERMRYAIELMRGARNSYQKAEDELGLPPVERDAGKIFDALNAADQKMRTLTFTLVVDPDQWKAVRRWSTRVEGPDASHYHSPATYIFYVMRLVILASDYNMRALNSGLEFEERIRLVRVARSVLEASMRVMMRRDISIIIDNAIAEE